MNNITSLVGKLERARRNLLTVAGRVPAGQWREQPAQGGWCAAEVVAHLTMVETAIVSGAAKGLQTEPQPVPLWKRWHIPPALATLRLVKVKTPLPLDSKLLGEKEAMLERIRSVREQTLAFLEANQHRDLRRWRRPHPILGSFNGKTWIKFIACHEARHTKQLREIVRGIQ